MGAAERYDLFMKRDAYDTLVVLGPTASGKTHLGVALAKLLQGEIVSADSRQVYRGLDVGSGKDLTEYRGGEYDIPYHLIDIVRLDEEYSVFNFQQDCFGVLESLHEKGALPIVVGGTGLYIEAVLSAYRMVEVPEDPALRRELSAESVEALTARLESLKTSLHNKTDLEDRKRLVRAIEIAAYTKDHEAPRAPPMRAYVLGVRWDRAKLKERIGVRLKERLEKGMIEEVEGLLEGGAPREKLIELGLEYRYVTQFLDGTIRNKNDLFQKLRGAIWAFAKRQETWFRRMERKGTEIHWIDEGRVAAAEKAVRSVRWR